MALLLPRLSKSSGSSVRINVWRQRRASLAQVGRVFPKSPDIAKSPDETLDLTTIGLSNKYNLLFPVVGNDRIPSRPMDYKKITDDDNSTEVYCTAPNLPELPGLPGERRGLKTPTEPPDFCLKGEGQRLPPYVIGTSKIENSPGGMVLKSICTQLHPWFETLSGQNVDESSIQEELKRLLYITKMRIYLEVRKKIYSPEVHCVPIFHCPCCLDHWTVSGWAPEKCPNSIQPTRGPEVVMYGTKMRFVSMHPKGKTNIMNRRQECPKKKIGIPFGTSRPPYPSIRTKERQDSSSEPHPSSTNPSRVSNHSSREKNEDKETKNRTPDLITLRTSSAGEIDVQNTFPELDHKNDRKYEEKAEGTVRSGADVPEGIPPSKASMSLIQSISQNDDHYNEYARSSSRNGKINEWKRRNTYGAHLYSDDPKSLWKTHMLTSPVMTILGCEDKAKSRHQKVVLTPASSNDSITGIQGKDFDVEASTQNRSDRSQSDDNTEGKAGDIQPALDGPQNLHTEVPQSKDQVHEHEQKLSEEALNEKISEGTSEKREDLSSLDNSNRSFTGKKRDKAEVSPLRNSALKKIDQATTKPAKNTVTWSDKKVLPKVSGDTHKGLDQDRKTPTSRKDPSPSAANAVPDKEASDERNVKRSLPPATDHFKEASKALRNMEEQIVKPENQVIKRYLEKSKPQDPQLADVHPQRTVESRSAEPLGSRINKDSARSSRGIITSAGRSDDKKARHPLSSAKESLTIEGAQEGLTLPYRRRTEMFHKKERKTTIKRPKHAYHSKEMENEKAETLAIKPQAFIKPPLPEATARYEKEKVIHTHESTLNTKDTSDDNIPTTAVLPSEHAQDWAKQDIKDEFRTVVADIRKDIEIVDMELPSRLSPTVEKGNKMESSFDEDDDIDDFFEEVDSKTVLFARISSEIHRLPVSNAFTFSFYELPSQYRNRNKKLEMASFKMGRGRRKRTI